MHKFICLLLIPLALTLTACEKPAGGEITETTAEETGVEITPAGYMEKLKLDEITVVETARPEPETLSDGLPSYGYCAVGEVDTADKKVAVLGENGVVATREYDGAAPAPGYVCAYETEGDYIAFTSVSMFPGFGTEYKGWVFGSYSSTQSIFYGSAYRCTGDSVFFVRYGDTQWRVFSGADALKADGEVSTGGYLYSPDGETVTFMLICGDCGDFGKLPPASSAQSKIFDPAGQGWDNGDITVKIAK